MSLDTVFKIIWLPWLWSKPKNCRPGGCRKLEVSEDIERQDTRLIIIVTEDKPLAEICEDNRVRVESQQSENVEHLQAREHLLKEMTRTGKDHHLNGIEQVKAVHLEPKPWTIADFLTPTLKSKRPQLRDHYKTIIERLYQHA